MSPTEDGGFTAAATATDFRFSGKTAIAQYILQPPPGYRTPAVGDTVRDVYHIEAALPQNRFTVVHRLLDERFELRLLPHVTSATFPGVLDRARSASVVTANLGVIVDLGRCPDYGYYAVAEAPTGARLVDLLEQGSPMSVDEVIGIGLDIGSALGALHEVGVAHGLVQLTDIVRAADGGWRLNGAGIPAAPDSSWDCRAPEVEVFADVSPASDQWVFAAILYELLTGVAPGDEDGGAISAPGQHRPGLPKELDGAFLRALETKPEDRWPEIESMLDVFQSSFHLWRQPSMVPFDAREVSRLLSMHPDLTSFARTGQKTRHSVVISVADLDATKPTLNISFHNVARLRREYRHNLTHGGLFVPTNSTLPPSKPVTVVLEFVPKELSVELSGIVSHTSAGDDVLPPGVGVVFDAPSVEKLLAFLRSAGAIQGAPAQDFVLRNPESSDDASLPADQLYLYSCVLDRVRIGELRADTRSLPIDFDEALLGLLDRGALLRQAAQDASGGSAAPLSLSTEVEVEFDAEDMFILLEQLAFHRERFSFLAASTLAERALLYSPADARLQHEYALVQARGLHNLLVGKTAASRAVELDPSRTAYRDTLVYVQALVEADSIRRIYSREFPITDVHFVGWDQSKACIWVRTYTGLDVERCRLLGIDVARDTIVHSETYEDAREMQLVWRPKRDAGGQPVSFKGAVGPAATSADGKTWAFDREPNTRVEGVYVRRAGGDLRTITQTKCTEVTISPNGSWLTWIQTADRDNVLMAAPARDGEPVELLRSPGTLVAVWNTKRDRPIVFDSDSGEVWLIDLDGTKEQIGQVEPGFAGVVCDALEATAAVVRESADGTTLDWVDLPKGTTRVSYQLDATLFDFVLRSDGCLVGRTGKGTILVDLSAQRHRHIEGIRLVPACLRNRHWLAPAPFVSMALRPNALELVAFKPDVLLG